ncbi:sensor histidine kinase [Minwuia sp.]|uniref:sensor histidine kinase n=1 Tax=Minwuia sp. TaxID=2493630 RepID=UPI003A916FB9
MSGRKRLSYRLRAIPPRFVDPDVEATYRQKWTEATRLTHKFWALASTIAYILISLLIGLAAEPGFVEFQWFRLLVCIPLQLLALQVVLRGDLNERFYQPLFLIKSVAIYGNAIISYAFAEAADVRLYLFECAVLFVFIQSFYPVRWNVITLFTICGTIGATVFLILADAGPAGEIVPLEITLLVTWGLALTCNFAHYSKEILSRRNFRQIQILRIRAEHAEDLAQEASRAASSKARFLAVAAHELRTPLNAMIGFAGLVEAMRDSSKPRSAQETRFAIIEREAKHIEQLVEAALIVTKDGIGNLAGPAGYFHLEALLAEAADSYGASASAVPVRLDREPGQPEHELAGDMNIYRTLVDGLIRQIQASHSPVSGIVLGFGKTRADSYAIHVRRDETVVPAHPCRPDRAITDVGPAAQGSIATASPLGLLKTLAHSQNAVIEGVAATGCSTGLSLVVPSSLVRFCRTSPVLRDEREAV